MTAENFKNALAWVWKPGYDDPADGYHVTPGDAGGGTLGGVIEATWASAVLLGVVTGKLKNATKDQLSAVLSIECWGSVCNSLPSGVDFLVFNGRMMSGGYPKILQQVLGVVPDGNIGPKTLTAAQSFDPKTLSQKLMVAHIYYLSGLGAAWAEFHNGWESRVLDAYVTALAMIEGGASA